jgi:hypothetical protein
MDARLDQATTLINAGIGTDTVRVDQATLDAVRAAAPDTSARAIPLAWNANSCDGPWCSTTTCQLG